MAVYDYIRPTTIDEAWQTWQGAEGQAAYLAGGTDLLLKIRNDKLDPALVISLRDISELKAIEDRGAEVFIGSAVSLAEIEDSPLCQSLFPVLDDAVTNMASIQIRHVATMGGNIINAAPSADTAPPLLCLGAGVVIAGPDGGRQVPLKDFYLGPYTTVLTPGELVTGFALPKPAAPAGGGYAKLMRRRAMDLALLGVAVQIEFEADRQTCARARIGLGVAAPTPVRTPGAEEFLKGQEISAEVLTRAGEMAAEEASPRHSIRCEAWYRVEMIKVFVRRMGLKALERAAG